LEKRGTPVLAVVTSEFESLGKACARGRGYPDTPFLILPHPFETLPPEVARRLADETFTKVVNGLTTPLKNCPVQPA